MSQLENVILLAHSYPISHLLTSEEGTNKEGTANFLKHNVGNNANFVPDYTDQN